MSPPQPHLVIANMEIALSNGYIFDEAQNDDVVFYCMFSNQRILFGTTEYDPSLVVACDQVCTSTSFIPTKSNVCDLGDSNHMFRDIYATGMLYGGHLTLANDVTPETLITCSNLSGTSFITCYNGNFGVNVQYPAYAWDVAGDVYASGNVFEASDARLKYDLQPITQALTHLSQLQGYRYRRHDSDSGNQFAGLIAQDVEKVMPELVSTDQKGFKSIAYGNMACLFVEAIKELRAHMTSMQEQIDALVLMHQT